MRICMHQQTIQIDELAKHVHQHIRAPASAVEHHHQGHQHQPEPVTLNGFSTTA